MCGYAWPAAFYQVLQLDDKYVGLILLENLKHGLLVIFVLAQE